MKKCAVKGLQSLLDLQPEEYTVQYSDSGKISNEFQPCVLVFWYLSAKLLYKYIQHVVK